jgi:primosomal protein N' (replication factor Y)
MQRTYPKATMADHVILRVALPTPLRRLFDYLPPQDIDKSKLVPGIRVQVPFQSRTLVGMLIGVVNSSSVPYGKLKRADSILDETPLLPDDVYKICHWAAEYYHYALGEVLSAALPVLLRKGKGVKCAPDEAKDAQCSPAETFFVSSEVKSATSALVLNTYQQCAVDAISNAANAFQTFLLDGVTGSGKTEVYLRAIEKTLQQDKQVLVLVPEISLTPQTIERFRARFTAPVVVLHSGLTEKQRLAGWCAAKSGEIRIVIGTRSAVFTPFASLGLIIVDEEHDQSFKQQDRFRYHARDMSIMRAHYLQIPVVLGSATPSLESLHNALRQRYQHLILPERAGKAVMPSYEIIDMRQIKSDEGLSPRLIDAIREHLAANNQVMLFLNRRGFAPVLYCTQCAWIADCKRCDARMVYHQTSKRLQCHHCDSRSVIPSCCSQCGGETLSPIGVGTQRLEQALEKYFSDVPIIRVDRDSTKRKGAMQELLDKIHNNPRAILIGTQMLAKGHHFPQVTLVGIVDADAGLFSADFRAAEQMGQLLLQVSGRAGRVEKPGTVLIQTQHVEHPLLTVLLNQGYHAFAQSLLLEREQAVLPPYSYFAIFRAEAYSSDIATDFLKMMKEWCRPISSAVSVLGPVPPLLAKRKGLHAQQLLIKADRRNVLQQFLQTFLAKLEALPKNQSVKWVLDVDPVETI